MNIENPDLLRRYLVQKGWIEANEQITSRELSGGVSCLTLWVQRQAGPDFVIKQARPKLKVQEDWFSDPARIHIEAAAMSALEALTPPNSVPKLLFEDEELHLLGMEAIPQPHDNWKSLLLKGHLESGHIRQFAQMLAGIHSLSLNKERYKQAFSNRHFFETLRLEPYYAFTGTQVPQAAGFLKELIQETLSIKQTLVHGDYSPKNVLVYKNRLILLDHEVMHYGDGAFDVGFSLTHLLSKARHLAGYREAFKKAALDYWEIYSTHFYLPTHWENRAIRHTVACMLARAKGKSTLEYLSGEEKDRQMQLCLELIQQIPDSIPELIAKI